MMKKKAKAKVIEEFLLVLAKILKKKLKEEKNKEKALKHYSSVSVNISIYCYSADTRIYL